MTFVLYPSPHVGGWQVLQATGDRAELLGAVVDEDRGARVVALLNRHGLHDVHLDHPAHTTEETTTT